MSETINEEKEESNSTGSSEFERISNSEANDMPDENEDDKEAADERIEETSPVEQVEELPKVEMDETRFLSFVDTTLESQCEAEKEEYSPATPDEESCVAEVSSYARIEAKSAKRKARSEASRHNSKLEIFRASKSFFRAQKVRTAKCRCA